MSACRSCGAEIIWGESKTTGKPMPLDAASKEKRVAVVGVTDEGTGSIGVPVVRVVDTYLSHFAVCDDPDRFRGGSS